MSARNTTPGPRLISSRAHSRDKDGTSLGRRRSLGAFRRAIRKVVGLLLQRVHVCKGSRHRGGRFRWGLFRVLAEFIRARSPAGAVDDRSVALRRANTRRERLVHSGESVAGAA